MTTKQHEDLKLYEIGDYLDGLLDLMDNTFHIDDETGEVISGDPLAIEEAVKLTELGNHKVAGIGYLIRNLETEAEARKKEADRLRKSAKVRENKIEWLKGYVLRYLAQSRQKAISTDDNVMTISAAKGRMRVEIPEGLDLTAWPDEFVKRTVEARKTPILDAWKEGKPIPDGVEIFEPTGWESLRIK